MTNKTYAVKDKGVFRIAVDCGPEHGWQALHIPFDHFYHDKRLFAFLEPITNPPEDLQEWQEIHLKKDRSLALEGQADLFFSNFEVKGKRGIVTTVNK
ncbi:hypothetical protein [Flavitalea sp.]|nr:hypothetical protein [Flavitalea sp.]